MGPLETVTLKRAQKALRAVSDYFSAYELANAIRYQSEEIRSSPLTNLVHKALADIDNLLGDDDESVSG